MTEKSEIISIIAIFKESAINGTLSNDTKMKLEKLVGTDRKESNNPVIEQHFELLFDALLTGSTKCKDDETRGDCLLAADDLIGVKLSKLNVCETKDFQLSITKHTLNVATHFKQLKPPDKSEYLRRFVIKLFSYSVNLNNFYLN